MRTFLLTLAVLLFAVVVVVACAGLPASELTAAERPPSAPGGLAFVSPIETPVPGVTVTPGQVLPPVVIDLALSTPVMVNQPVTLTISIRANMEIDEGSAFGFGLKTASAGFLENYTMTLPSLAQNEVMQMTQILQIPGKEGRYSITAALSPRNIGNTIYAQAIYFAVNGTSIVFSPTPGPAMAATVELIGRPTSAPTQTPEAPVTPVPEVTSTPEPGAASPVLPVTTTTETAAETSIKRAQTETVTIKGRLRISCTATSPGRSRSDAKQVYEG